MAKFAKDGTGWLLELTGEEHKAAQGGQKSVTVNMRAGGKKTIVVKSLIRTRLHAGAAYHSYTFVSDTKPAPQKSRPTYASDTCPDCEENMDAGDMMGCPRHRGTALARS